MPASHPETCPLCPSPLNDEDAPPSVRHFKEHRGGKVIWDVFEEQIVPGSPGKQVAGEKASAKVCLRAGHGMEPNRRQAQVS